MYGIQLCTTKGKATFLHHEQLFCPFVSSLVSLAPLCLTHVRKACTNDTNIKAHKEWRKYTQRMYKRCPNGPQRRNRVTQTGHEEETEVHIWPTMEKQMYTNGTRRRNWGTQMAHKGEKEVHKRYTKDKLRYTNGPQRKNRGTQTAHKGKTEVHKRSTKEKQRYTNGPQRKNRGTQTVHEGNTKWTTRNVAFFLSEPSSFLSIFVLSPPPPTHPPPTPTHTHTTPDEPCQ